MKKSLLLSAGALALSVTFSGAALATDNINGTLSGSYATGTEGGGGDIYGINGSLTGMVANNWGVEGNGGYHNVSDGGGDLWDVGGSVFWAGMQGRLAATANYHDLSGAHFTNYGVGGEWFAGSNFTAAIKGGGLSGSGSSGGYAGGMLQWYLIPNLSLDGSVDYLDISGGHFTTESVKAEWLISSSTPVSLYAGYQHVDVGVGGFGSGSLGNVVFVGLKLYAGGDGTLVDHQRNGSLGYVSESPLFLDQY